MKTSFSLAMFLTLLLTVFQLHAAPESALTHVHPTSGTALTHEFSPAPGTRTLSTTFSSDGKATHKVVETPPTPQMAAAKEKAMADAETCPVTIIIDPSETGDDTAFAIDLINEERMVWSDVYRKEVTFEVPADTYLLQVSFSKDNWAVVFIPDIEVDGAKEIHVSRDMADVALTAQPLLPDGAPVKLPLLDEDEKPYGDYNAYVNYFLLQITYNNYTYDTYSITAQTDSEDYSKFLTMYTNLPSDKVRFIYSFFINTTGNSQLVFNLDRTADKALVNNKICNDINLYKLLKVDIAHTKAYAEMGQDNTYSSFEYNTYYPNNELSCVNGGANSPVPFDVWICNDMSKDDGVYALATFASSDYYKNGRNMGGIYTPGAMYDDGELKFYSTPDLSYVSDSEQGVRPVPINENFSFHSFEDLCFGKTNAYCVTTFQNVDWVEPSFTYILPSYLGNLNETRTIDYRMSTVEVKYDGNVVMERQSTTELYKWLQEWWANNKPTNQITYTFYNENIEVEGIQGSNVCEVTVNTTGDDTVNPTIQKVMLRDRNGSPTIYFQNLEDGMLTIAGGDFIQHTFAVEGPYGTENRSNFTYAPAQLSVFYSPYGKNSFRTLRMKEIPEKFFMPGYGAYWEAEMSDMDLETSDNGWYDLKIELRDESGNIQTQILSPAFHVENFTDIDAVSTAPTDFNAANGCIYASTGNLAEVYTVQGLHIANRNLAPGIYIAKQGNSIAKVLVR